MWRSRSSPRWREADLYLTDATALARDWVAEHAPHTAAYLGGSATWLAPGQRLPPTSDLDLFLVPEHGTGPRTGKFRHRGTLLEVTALDRALLADPAAVLADYHLAPALRRDTVLADPAGWLRPLQRAVAADFAAETWVRRRCADAEARLRDRLARAAEPGPWPWRVTWWLFGTGISTHVLLTAGLRNPTVRRRYSATRELLPAGQQEELLAALGCAHLTPDRVRTHLATMTRLFDEAGPAAEGSGLPFASDLSPAARAVAVDGTAAQIEAGEHREAVFWLVATCARALLALRRDDDPGFAELLADLGQTGPADLRAQIGRTRSFLPRLAEIREEVLVRTLA